MCSLLGPPPLLRADRCRLFELSGLSLGLSARVCVGALSRPAEKCRDLDEAPFLRKPGPRDGAMFG